MESVAPLLKKRFRDDQADSNSPKKLKTVQSSISEQEESHFIELFSKIADILSSREKITGEVISNAVGSIIESFRYNEGRRFSNIDLSVTKYVCGYLYRYAPLSAGLMRSRLLEAVNECNTLRFALQYTELNVISLGGGPGSDVVGFCSALNELRGCRNLNFTVVDSVQRWSSCLNLAEFLLREDYYGNASELINQLETNLSFIRIDLPGNLAWDSKYFRSLREADVVILARLVSIMPDESKAALIKSVSEEMKPEAMLLFVDSPFRADEWSDFNVLYCSESGKYYKFSKVSEKFGFTNATDSKSQIAVLCKKTKI